MLFCRQFEICPTVTLIHSPILYAYGVVDKFDLKFKALFLYNCSYLRNRVSISKTYIYYFRVIVFQQIIRLSNYIFKPCIFRGFGMYTSFSLSREMPRYRVHLLKLYPSDATTALSNVSRLQIITLKKCLINFGFNTIVQCYPLT